MSKKDRVCSICGVPCYGHTCRDCYIEKKYGGLSRQESSRNYYVKQVQHLNS